MLTLGFVCSSFLTLLGNRLGYLIFLVLEEGLLISQTSLLDPLLLPSSRFYKVLFSLSFALKYFLISSLISSVTHWLLEACLVFMFLYFSDIYLCD